MPRLERKIRSSDAGSRIDASGDGFAIRSNSQFHLSRPAQNKPVLRKRSRFAIADVSHVGTFELGYQFELSCTIENLIRAAHQLKVRTHVIELDACLEAVHDTSRRGFPGGCFTQMQPVVVAQ